MNACPSPDQLAQLRDQLTRQLAEESTVAIGTEAGAIQAHIQDCPACQHRFDELTSGDVAFTPPTAAQETPPAFLERLRQEDPQRLLANAGREDDEPGCGHSPGQQGSRPVRAQPLRDPGRQRRIQRFPGIPHAATLSATGSYARPPASGLWITRLACGGRR